MDVSRYFNNTEIKFTIEFITPTYLGGADGDAELRTPPIKNLIRRWWRVVNCSLSTEELWQKESALFGSIKDNPNTDKPFGKSTVNLSFIDLSKDKEYYSTEPFTNKKTFQNMMYMGYGLFDKNSNRRYIKPNTRISCLLTCPKENKEELEKTLFLINLFGSLGARSLKGFGSISITPINFKFDIAKQFPKSASFNKLLASKKDYPTYLGTDNNGILAWMTKDKAYDTWEEVLLEFSNFYKEIIGELKNDDREYKTFWRKIIGSPVTKSKTKDKNGSKNNKPKNKFSNDVIPSQLIFKIIKTGTKDKIRYAGQVFHFPYPISIWNEEDGNQEEIWQYVHEYLDSYSAFTGCFGRKGGN